MLPIIARNRSKTPNGILKSLTTHDKLPLARGRPMAFAGKMHRSGVNKESGIIFSCSFGRRKYSKIEQFLTQYGQFETSRFPIYHVCIKHDRAVGGVSGIFTQGSLRESAVIGRPGECAPRAKRSAAIAQSGNPRDKPLPAGGCGNPLWRRTFAKRDLGFSNLLWPQVSPAKLGTGPSTAAIGG